MCQREDKMSKSIWLVFRAYRDWSYALEWAIACIVLLSCISFFSFITNQRCCYCCSFLVGILVRGFVCVRAGDGDGIFSDKHALGGKTMIMTTVIADDDYDANETMLILMAMTTTTVMMKMMMTAR